MQKYYANVALLATPTQDEHIVNKKYVDLAISKKVKEPVVAVLGTNLDATYNSTNKTLTQTTAAVLVVDGVTVAVGDRVLIAGQTDATQNGIYTVTTLGTATVPAVLTRAVDFDSTSDISLNTMIPVQQGTQNADSTWSVTNDTAITLDTTPINFGMYRDAAAPKKYQTTFSGDGTTTSWTITHGLNTDYLTVSMYDAASKSPVYFEYEATTSNTITVSADFAPDNTESFVVVIVG